MFSRSEEKEGACDCFVVVCTATLIAFKIYFYYFFTLLRAVKTCEAFFYYYNIYIYITTYFPCVCEVNQIERTRDFRAQRRLLLQYLLRKFTSR